MTATPNSQAETKPKVDGKWMASYLKNAMIEIDWDPRTPQRVRHLANSHPELFFNAAADWLESEGDKKDCSPRAHRLLGVIVIHLESFFEYLTNPLRRSTKSAVRIFRHLLLIDPTLDFKLARTLSGRNDITADRVLSSRHAARAIEILDQTSPGTRLLAVIGHLPNSSDSVVATKAAIFVGRRVNNPSWIEKQLSHEDDRHRANALEGTWGRKSPAAVEVLRQCTTDPNNRVAGNALIGLHMAECEEAGELALEMSNSDQPGRRRTAAWAMGKIGNPAFLDRLTALLRDENKGVRSTAIRAIVEIGQVETRKRKIIEDAASQSASVAREAEGKEPSTNEPDVPEGSIYQFDLKLDGSRVGAKQT